MNISPITKRKSVSHYVDDVWAESVCVCMRVGVCVLCAGRHEMISEPMVGREGERLVRQATDGRDGLLCFPSIDSRRTYACRGN